MCLPAPGPFVALVDDQVRILRGSTERGETAPTKARTSMDMSFAELRRTRPGENECREGHGGHALRSLLVNFRF